MHALCWITSLQRSILAVLFTLYHSDYWKQLTDFKSHVSFRAGVSQKKNQVRTGHQGENKIPAREKYSLRNVWWFGLLDCEGSCSSATTSNNVLNWEELFSLAITKSEQHFHPQPDIFFSLFFCFDLFCLFTDNESSCHKNVKIKLCITIPA